MSSVSIFTEPDTFPLSVGVPSLPSIAALICVDLDLFFVLTEMSALSSPPSSQPEIKVSFLKLATGVRDLTACTYAVDFSEFILVNGSTFRYPSVWILLTILIVLSMRIERIVANTVVEVQT